MDTVHGPDGSISRLWNKLGPPERDDPMKAFRNPISILDPLEKIISVSAMKHMEDIFYNRRY